ncbi:PH domain-containing protein [Ferrimonas kyonanensis]|uniref:PH domain-containing protein n=1 Tax=Ferrimonas kyonanensis TaxID=364763 RepID=UPI00041EC750|nr:PH domain-containing protein [Ferrimonas kyonanensis]
MEADTPIPPPSWRPIRQIDYQPVSPAYLTLVTLTAVATILLPSVALLTMLIFRQQATLPLIGATVLLSMLLMLATVVIRRLKAQRLGYALRPGDVVVQSGLIWQQRISLPLSRLQHVSVTQGPLERRLNLATLNGYSAGSPQAEIVLPGLEPSLAEQLRQQLMDHAGVQSDES